MSKSFSENSKFKLEEEKIINKYTDELNNLKKIFIKKLSALRNNEYVFFKSYYTTNSIEKYNENKCDIVLYNQNNNEFNKNDFIKYLDNNDKVIYFNNLYKNINQKCNIKDIKDIENIESILKINKLESIFNSIKNDFDINELIELEFKYKDIEKIIELRDSFKSYFNYRSNNILSIAKASKIGKTGEDNVNKFLNIYEDEIFNLQNIRLEIKGNSIENDNILISKHGIFVIEVKNIGSTGGYDIKIEKDGRWLKVYKNKKPEIIGYNATMQNDRHIVYLKKLINEKLNNTIDNYIDVKGIVVIANDTITINNESDQDVYRTSEIYRYITKHKEIFKLKQMEEIKGIIISNNLEPKKYPIIDFEKEIIHNINYLDKETSKIDINYLVEFKNIVEEYKSEKLNIESRQYNEIRSLEEAFRPRINSYKNTNYTKLKDIINKAIIVIFLILIIVLFPKLNSVKNTEHNINHVSENLTNESKELVEYHDLTLEDYTSTPDMANIDSKNNLQYDTLFGTDSRMSLVVNDNSGDIIGLSISITNHDIDNIWEYKAGNAFIDGINRKIGEKYSQTIKNSLNNYSSFSNVPLDPTIILDNDKIYAHSFQQDIIFNGNDITMYSVQLRFK